jgi:hypothetical protein
MNRMRMQSVLLALPLALLLCLAPQQAAAQDGYLFEADISGEYEVPPTSAPQTGHVALTLNAEMTEASYVIEYDPIPDETAAHFHLAPPGTNGPVVHGLPAGNPKVGVWMISPEHVTALFDGNIYVNIHSAEFPGGAIRGNLTTYVVSAEASSWSQIKTLFR